MALIKNEHIIWAYGQTLDNRQVIIVGITEMGVDYLKSQSEPGGKTLFVEPPHGIRFTDIQQIIIFYSKSKEELKEVLRKGGMIISEIH